MEHSFNVEVAREYGIPAAILLKQISIWIKKNRREGRNLHDGCTWTYNSAAEMARIIPYMSEYQINRALSRMVQAGLIKRGNFNRTAQDRTAWYTLTERAENLLSDFAEMQNGTCKNAKSNLQICKMEVADLQNGSCNFATPLPSNNTSNITSISSPPIVPPAGDGTEKKPDNRPDTHKAERHEIIAYLNEKAGTRYRENADNAKRRIDARLNAGYTVEDFHAVIDSKCADWLGTEYAKFLRPETLFGPKFDEYRGAADIPGVKKGQTGIRVNFAPDEDLKDIFGG